MFSILYPNPNTKPTPENLLIVTLSDKHNWLCLITFLPLMGTTGWSPQYELVNYPVMSPLSYDVKADIITLVFFDLLLNKHLFSLTVVILMNSCAA